MHQQTKTDYFLAQIAAEIAQVREMFAKNPKSIDIRSKLIKFTDQPQEEPRQEEPKPDLPETHTMRNERVESKKVEPPKEKQYEIGPELVKNPKWAEVNRRAQQLWAARMGVKSLEDLNRGRE